MKNFTYFLAEAAIAPVKISLKHPEDLDHESFGKLVTGGKVRLGNATEKTDGRSFHFGHDEKGFWTRGSGSGQEKMRSPEDHLRRAKERNQSPGAGAGAADIHKTLASNQELQKHLAHLHRNGHEVHVAGEAFYLPDAQPDENNEGHVKFVNTPYKKSMMGKKGAFVIHSQLPSNKGLKLNLFKNKLSNKNGMTFDHDKIEHNFGDVDVGREATAYGKLNHGLLSAKAPRKGSRMTPEQENAEKKRQAEHSRFEAIRSNVGEKVRKHVRGAGLKSKWGNQQPEGWVFHAHEDNPNAPKIKIVSDEFAGRDKAAIGARIKSEGPRKYDTV